MSDSSWIRINREIQDDPLWTSEAFTRGQALLDLMMDAAPNSFDVQFKDRLVTMPEGTVMSNNFSLMSRWRWDNKKFNGFLRASTVKELIEKVNYMNCQFLVFRDTGFIDKTAKEAALFEQSSYFRRLAKKSSTQDLRVASAEWSIIRDRIIARDNGCCVYCGDFPDSYHVDHVVPLARGGSNEDSNLATACAPCNLSKGSKLLSEWGGR